MRLLILLAVLVAGTALAFEDYDPDDFTLDVATDDMTFVAADFVWGQSGQHEVATITFKAEGEADQEITFQCDRRCTIVLTDEFGDERGVVLWDPER